MSTSAKQIQAEYQARVLQDNYNQRNPDHPIVVRAVSKAKRPPKLIDRIFKASLMLIPAMWIMFFLMWLFSESVPGSTWSIFQKCYFVVCILLTIFCVLIFVFCTGDFGYKFEYLEYKPGMEIPDKDELNIFHPRLPYQITPSGAFVISESKYEYL